VGCSACINYSAWYSDESLKGATSFFFLWHTVPGVADIPVWRIADFLPVTVEVFYGKKAIRQPLH
jgi:hypothetical protein